MKPLLTGALFAALSPAALANGAEPSSDWLGLDEELNAVASPVALQGGGVSIGALFRGAYISADMDDFGGFGADQLGMVVDDVELWHEGSIEQYSWRISVDFGQPISPYSLLALLAAPPVVAQTTRTDLLEDAYVDWHFDERFSLRLGHFVFPTSFASQTDPGSTLFMDRTTNGDLFHQYSLGAMLSGDYDVFEWFVAVLNGADDTGDEHAFALRGVYNLGDGASGEGALGGGDDFNASIGASFVQDDGLTDDSEVITIDILGSVGQFGFGGELVNYGDGVVPGLGGVPIALPYDEGPSLFSVFGSYLINEQWEIAARFEDLGDEDDTTAISFGVNFYQAGHNAKWQLLYKDVASDAITGVEGSIIALGITVGASRNG